MFYVKQRGVSMENKSYQIYLDLMDTGLFCLDYKEPANYKFLEKGPCFDNFFPFRLTFINMPRYCYIYGISGTRMYQSCNHPLETVWFKTTLEKIFEISTLEIQEKMMYHMNVLRRVVAK